VNLAGEPDNIGAEGAISPKTLRHIGPQEDETLERG